MMSNKDYWEFMNEHYDDYDEYNDPGFHDFCERYATNYDTYASENDLDHEIDLLEKDEEFYQELFG